MGINIFVVTNTLDNLEQQVDQINEHFGGDEHGSFFYWADLFSGEGGHLLTLEQAVAFEQGAEPWYIVSREENNWVILEASKIGWQKELTDLFKEGNHVIFLKARN